jgi:tricarballylate dehydrogenase
MTEDFDVVVVGAGNAALPAAIAAREAGARVLVLEKAPPAERGGNSRFTGGLLRFAFDSKEQVLGIVEDLGDVTAEDLDVAGYPAGAGLMRGTVFGRIAGAHAARHAQAAQAVST